MGVTSLMFFNELFAGIAEQLEGQIVMTAIEGASNSHVFHVDSVMSEYPMGYWIYR